MTDRPIFDENINVSIDAYKENPNYDKQYERYDFMYNIMQKEITSQSSLSFLDIGCGDSSFLYYMRKKHPDFNYTGLEISQDLIDIAKNEEVLKSVELIQGDARDFEADKQYDMVLLSGVLSIFDDIEPPLVNMCKHLKKGGMGYIFGGFCSEDIDVMVRYRNNVKNSDLWESGWNMYSLDTTKRALAEYAEEINATKFQISIDLEEKSDPVRTFTLTTKEKGRIVVTGGNIIREHFLIEFRKK